MIRIAKVRGGLEPLFTVPFLDRVSSPKWVSYYPLTPDQATVRLAEYFGICLELLYFFHDLSFDSFERVLLDGVKLLPVVARRVQVIFSDSV